jgi:hypothetical protein
VPAGGGGSPGATPSKKRRGGRSAGERSRQDPAERTNVLLMRKFAIAGLSLLLGCGGQNAEAPPAREPAPAPAGALEAPVADSVSEPAAAGDAPEISRSAGVEGGVVVLWPRIVLPRGSAGPDDATRKLAAQVQQQLAGIAARALPGHPGDIRPEPERVCPRSGCKSVSVGVLLARAGAGCSVIAVVTPPGPQPGRLVPWSGVVQLEASSVGFREPPERSVRVKDYERCDAHPEALARRAAEIEAAIRAAASR